MLGLMPHFLQWHTKDAGPWDAQGKGLRRAEMGSQHAGRQPLGHMQRQTSASAHPPLHMSTATMYGAAQAKMGLAGVGHESRVADINCWPGMPMRKYLRLGSDMEGIKVVDSDWEISGSATNEQATPFCRI